MKDTNDKRNIEKKKKKKKIYCFIILVNQRQEHYRKAL